MSPLPPIPERFQRLDQLLLGEHARLTSDDECYFIWERQFGKALWDVPVNNFINNLQKQVDFGPGPLHYKSKAIHHAAEAVASLIPDDWISDCTWIPVPPSKTKQDPLYDDRLSRVLRMLRTKPPHPPFDFRELVTQVENTVSKAKDITPEERASKWTIVEELTEPAPERIVVFDDVLAGGSHFKGMEILLRGRFPRVAIRGVFLARQIHDDTFIFR